MNKLMQRTHALVHPHERPTEPAQADQSGSARGSALHSKAVTERPADRRPVWRRGTLVLVACLGVGFSAMACSNPAATGGPDVTQLPAQTIMPGETAPANPTVAPTSGLGY